MSDVAQHNTARIMREALIKIADFPYDDKNRDLTFSQAVGRMVEIAQSALERAKVAE